MVVRAESGPVSAGFETSYTREVGNDDYWIKTTYARAMFADDTTPTGITVTTAFEVVDAFMEGVPSQAIRLKRFCWTTTSFWLRDRNWVRAIGRRMPVARSSLNWLSD